MKPSWEAAGTGNPGSGENRLENTQNKSNSSTSPGEQQRGFLAVNPTESDIIINLEERWGCVFGH